MSEERGEREDQAPEGQKLGLVTLLTSLFRLNTCKETPCPLAFGKDYPIVFLEQHLVLFINYHQNTGKLFGRTGLSAMQSRNDFHGHADFSGPGC